MYFPECFIPWCRHLHPASQQGHQVPLQIGDVPLLELEVELTLQPRLDRLQEEKEQWKNLASIINYI